MKSRDRREDKVDGEERRTWEKVVNTLDHATCGVGASAGSLCNRETKEVGVISHG